MLRLALGLASGEAAPNAQLRVLNLDRDGASNVDPRSQVQLQQGQHSCTPQARVAQNAIVIEIWMDLPGLVKECEFHLCRRRVPADSEALV